MSILIVGGGMAGATLALAISHLTQGKLAVHLVEATPPSSTAHPGFDARAIALAQGTVAQLARIGIWQNLAECATVIETVHVSDKGHAGFVTIEARDYQIDALGQVVELHEVGQRLFSLLKRARGVTLHCPARVTKVARDEQHVDVTLSNGQQIRSALLVAADGSRSTIGEQCGIRWQNTPYHQLAVIANVTTAQPHRGRAFERFTEHGPLAVLPMTQGRCSLVWCHPLGNQQVLEWSDARFCDELQKVFGWRLGRITHAGARSAYPLVLSRAESSVSHRVALVGNASQTLHPIAGQGFNLGMRDVISLAENVAQAWQDGEDVGGFAVLNAWQRQREPDRDATVGVTDGLVHLFANHWSPLIVGRNLGLMGVEIFTPARDALARRTLGWVAR